MSMLKSGKVHIGDYLEDKCSKFQWSPCNSPEDYCTIEAMNEAMDAVRLDFSSRANESARVAADMWLD